MLHLSVVPLTCRSTASAREQDTTQHTTSSMIATPRCVGGASHTTGATSAPYRRVPSDDDPILNPMEEENNGPSEMSLNPPSRECRPSDAEPEGCLSSDP